MKTWFSYLHSDQDQHALEVAMYFVTNSCKKIILSFFIKKYITYICIKMHTNTNMNGTILNAYICGFFHTCTYISMNYIYI